MHARICNRFGFARFICCVSGLLLLGPLGGCKTVQVHLGLKVDLTKAPVTTIEAKMAGDPGIAPGESNGLIVTFTEPDGKVLVTQGKGKGKVLWSDLAVTTTLVTFKKGAVTLPHDPRKSEDKVGHITVTVPSHPALRAELDVPVRYDYPFQANYSGVAGSNGSGGFDGQAGSAGSSGSTDPNNPSPGGDGGNGSNGGDGGDGGNGGDAPDLNVKMTLHPGTPVLVEASVTPSHGGKTHLYLIDPNGGSLTVLALGGPGGKGGSGGRGGAGGAGGSGIPSGSNGSAGRDGNSGSDGRDGQPGAIAVTYDPAAEPYLSLLHLNNGNGPKPQLTKAAVAPLW